jgi:cytochrome P450
MQVATWTRWLAMHGVPRAFLSVQAHRGDPLARILRGADRWGDPYPLSEQIRQQGRLVRTPFVAVTTDHEVCRIILRDNRFKASFPANMDLPGPLRSLISRTDLGLPNPVEPPAMVVVDPPDHTRYRRLVAQSFTPRAIDSLATRVAEATTQLLDGLDSTPEPDLLHDFAAQLPVAVIAEILGLPVDTHPHLLQWGSSGAPLLDMGISWATFRRAVDGLREVDNYLREHLQQLRAGEPSDNPFSRLATGEDVTDRELTANAALLIGAGFETTVNLIGNGIVLLLRHPEQLSQLLDNPDLWAGAVEEILRFDSPVQMTARTARSDVEIVGDHIRAGEMVALLFGGANRDPRVFTNPGRFDITRPNAREHLAFGSGVHACLGAALARIEGTVALRALFDRFPDLSLSAQPQRRGLVNLRGFKSLPVRLGSKRTSAAARPA